jgi:dTDP-4-dehydrorhamnose reductase
MSIRQKILVTGANGQLGKELQRLSASFSNFNFTFLSREELSITDREQVANVFNTYQPEYCINCAAYTAVDKAEVEKEEAFAINGNGPAILAALCAKNNCRFIHISTDYVFDGESIKPYTESDITNPLTVYGASKRKGEIEVLQNDPSAIIIRTSWVYSEYGKNFIKTMLRLMNDKEEIGVVNDQFGSPTYAADLAEAILKICSNDLMNNEKAKGIFHFSNEGIISWFDLAISIKELTNSKCKVNPITTAQYPTPAKRPAFSALDCSKFSEVFDIRMKPWEESLKVCLARLNSL